MDDHILCRATTTTTTPSRSYISPRRRTTTHHHHKSFECRGTISVFAHGPLEQIFVPERHAPTNGTGPLGTYYEKSMDVHRTQNGMYGLDLFLLVS